MKINGYQIREALRRATLRRQVWDSQFKESLFAFKDDQKSKPDEIVQGFREADERIARLQELQQSFNQKVTLEVLGKPMTLALAVKMVGGAGRVEKMWRIAAAGKEESRYGGDIMNMQRSKDSEYAVRQISQKDALIRADEAARYASSLRDAIARGNNVIVDLEVEAGLLE